MPQLREILPPKEEVTVKLNFNPTDDGEIVNLNDRINALNLRPRQPQKPIDPQGYLDEAYDALRLVKGILVGSPENAVDKTKNWIDWGQIGDSEGMALGPLPFPGERMWGAADAALAALPLIGRAGRATVEGMQPFFSQLRRSIIERSPQTAMAEHFLNVARKGAKAEELEWTGLEHFLTSNAGQRLKRDDVLKYLDANAPELREVMIARPADKTKLPEGFTMKKIDGNTHGAQIKDVPMYGVLNRTGEPLVWGSSPESALTQFWASGFGGVRTKPKFTEYTLPGGTNHREFVMTMPAKPNDGAHLVIEPMPGGGFRLMDTAEDAQIDTYATRAEADADRAEILRDPANTLPSAQKAGFGPGSYHVPSGHAYNDPELDVNRLFHQRFNDRTTDAGERALHMEELQSDWHQTGRETGYTNNLGKMDQEQKRIAAKAYDNTADNDIWFSEFGLKADDVNRMTEEERIEFIQNNVPEFALRTFYHDAAGEPVPGVPDAPFKKTWHELGMRRALQEVAAGDYDRLTWTTGAQQADRYRLSTHVNALSYDPIDQRLRYREKTRSDWTVYGEKIKPEGLAAVVGKDVAQKLLDQSLTSMKSLTDAATGKPVMTHMLQGPDLDIGGQGMKGFYDKMLPEYANKLGKKYGVKAEKVRVPDEIDPNKLELAKGKWRQSELDNHVEYLNDLTDNELKSQFNEMFPDDTGRHTRQYMINNLYDQAEFRLLDTDVDVDELIEIGYLDKPKAHEVWSIKMTPEMRRDVLEQGQPLFGKVPPVPIPMRREEEKK